MLLIDALVRVSAMTMLIVIAIFAIRDLRHSRSWLYLVLASISTAALYISLSTAELAPSHSLAVLFGFLNVPHLFFVWLFVLSVFQTNFSLSKWHFLIGIGYTLPIFWFRAFQFDFLNQPPLTLTAAVAIGSILLMAHLIWTIWNERDGDLIASRLNSRIAFIWILAIVAAATAVADLVLIITWPDHANLIKATMIWPAVFAAFFWIFRVDRSLLVVQSNRSFSEGKPSVSSKDVGLYQALQARILRDHVYLDSDLTISALAKDLGVTSHRLRKLINQSLGYENFNQFLNSYRIAAIQTKFDNGKNDHIPILTIALDGGFRSLAPFNKAFKQITGQTPSDYRKL